MCVPWSKCLAGYKFAGSLTRDRDCSECSGDKYFLTEYEFRSQMDLGVHTGRNVYTDLKRIYLPKSCNKKSRIRNRSIRKLYYK